MPSPFPGMDPWLEDEEVFPNLHDRFTIFLQDALNAVLPAGYAALTKNRVWVDPELRRDPDVSVFGRDRSGRRTASGGLALATLEQAGLQEAIGEPESDPIEEPYLEIRSHRGKRLVTAIELLSRANKKPGDTGRTSYLQKQMEYRPSGVNSVEIDLLRSGRHTTSFPQDRVRDSRADYHVSITIPTSPPRSFFVPIRMTEPLPTIPIPLDWDVPPVNIDLQSVLVRCVDGVRFHEFIRYDLPPDPPLTPEQQAWAETIHAKRRQP